MTPTSTEDLRNRFYRLLPELLAEDPRAVAVFAEIGGGYWTRPRGPVPTESSTSGSGSS